MGDSKPLLGVFRLFGMPVVMDPDWAQWLDPLDLKPDFEIKLFQGEPHPIQTPCFLTYQSRWLVEDGRPRICLYLSNDGARIVLPRLGVFDLLPDKIIGYIEQGIQSNHHTADLFLTTIVPAWLAMRGSMVLHASAVSGPEGSIAFLAYSQGGKSTLAAAFCRSGFRFLSDDIFVVEKQDNVLAGFASYPFARLWPQALESLGLDPRQFERVEAGFEQRIVPARALGAVELESRPIRRLYLPQITRQSTGKSEVHVERLPQQAQLIAVVKNFYGIHLARAMKVEAAHLALAAELMQKVEVRRLVYPAGFAYLPEIIATVQQDLVDA